jgi:putative hydrolase of the HAD superfamily
MPIELLFLDLDDTLYPPESGLWPEIGRRIDLFMMEQIGIPAQDVRRLRGRYLREYGTTLNGLRMRYGVDPQEYLAFVHDLPLQDFLHRDDALRGKLTALPQPKWIFSNADRPHIERVLTALGMDGIFDGIIDIYATGFACKPFERAYTLAMQLANVTHPETCLLADDQPRNLEPAVKLGMTAVLVHARSNKPIRTHSLPSIHDLPDFLANQP